ncbi:TRAP transporter large permease subunit [Tropicibacter naphthalenivorans]|uniref:TRAP transporter, 4TM/12TM fusion protein n=1 Tax=Tropicibacter naphthalenivorans TaxID=441103 RepID=A0A0P1GXU0_9RHOB|nr:TRAP transporter large permease subunit [Tropicibacter naphthalenivorans]CUH80738.1 TRAP transporter, 4TM/12TM fusion protein [Tropicibacter naphthalenivorans]SMC89868.1 Tripartite ATP-independent transporter, DctM component [Tropicibacter naphthalenivorans]
MTDSQTLPLGKRIAVALALILVVLGMTNTMPEIPGLQGFFREITGQPFFRVSGFAPEYFYPPVFVLMMVIVALDASVYREWSVMAPQKRWLGLGLDIGLVLAAVLGAVGFLVEIDSVCLIDQITGERARLIQEAAERSAGVIPGMTFEAEVLACQARFGGWIIPLLFTIITLFFLYNWRVWGLPLVAVASTVVAYTVGTALIWMFDLSDNTFLLTKLGADGGDVMAAAVQKATNVFITPDGFMGRFMDIVVNQVFPYVILGALFGTSAGGTSLIKLAVRATARLRVEPMRDIPQDLVMNRQDWLNLIIIVVPILTILLLLLGNKDSISTGLLSQLLPRGFTQTITNATGDAVSAGWWAVAVLLPLLFLDPETRARPSKILHALAEGGILVSRLFLLLFAVSIISAFLNESGLTGELTPAVTSWLENAQVIHLFGIEIHIVGGVYLMLALTCAMVCAILLGMGMPTVPAYVNVALLGPLLANLGVSFFTAHMFVFYFAVASAITPPVAIAAFAAASITKSEPMRTGIAAVRVGIVMFTIPFVFAWYPELLLIEQAVTITDAMGRRTLIEGYAGQIDPVALTMLGARLVLALYLMASALARYDRGPMASWEIGLRLLLAVLVLWKTGPVMGFGIAAALALIALHWMMARKNDGKAYA